MTKFRKLLETSPASETSSVQARLPRSHTSQPRIPEKVLIRPRRKFADQNRAMPDPTAPVHPRPKKISAQAYRLAPVYRPRSQDMEQETVTVEISAEILKQAQAILENAEAGSLSTLIDVLLSEWIRAQEQ